MHHIRIKNDKDTQFLAKVRPWDARKLGLAGPTQKFVIVMACPSNPYFVTRWVMSIHKSLFDIVRPSTLRKPEKRIPESDTDQGDDTQVKKHKFCPKWLGEFHWLKYDSTEKQMKCKVCLEIMRIAENLILHKIFSMEQIIWS